MRSYHNQCKVQVFLYRLAPCIEIVAKKTVIIWLVNNFAKVQKSCIFLLRIPQFLSVCVYVQTFMHICTVNFVYSGIQKVFTTLESLATILLQNKIIAKSNI